MRHQYTPIFRDFLTSSLWVSDPATRCVWIWMLLSADPEGFVPGTVPGIANAANVPLSAARDAVALLEAPDPDSSSPELEGRRIVRVERGWHIVNFIAWRERAKAESEKARKRRWAKKAYDARQLDLPGIELAELPEPDLAEPDLAEPDLAEPSEPLDAPKPIPKPIPKEEEGSGSPLPPVCASHELGSDLRCVRCGTHLDALPPGSMAIVQPGHVEPVIAHTQRIWSCACGDWLRPGHPEGMCDHGMQIAKWRAIDPQGYAPSPGRFNTLAGMDEAGLEDEAVMAGMGREWFRERLAAAKNIPIGGYAGVLDQRQWVRLQFGRWKTWEEEARAKASRRPEGAGPGLAAGPTPAVHERIRGCPAWVRRVHADFAGEHRLDLKALGKRFAKSYHLPVKSLHPNDIEAPFLEFLRQEAAREVA